MKNRLLTYAIKDKKIVNISSVESGIACGCICPSCGEKLIARKGKIKVHHFAHQGNSECEYGYQTAIHLAAKDIIANNSVILERRLDDIIPDIIINTSIGLIIVEIYVTHKVDNEKKKKIENLGIPAIEIDLSKYKYFKDEDLEILIISEVKNKHWIYNQKVADAISKLKSVSEYKPIICRGYALHVDFCPICCRVWNGKTYANVVDDCIECNYCIGQTNSFVICAGKKRVTSYEDLFLNEQDNHYVKKMMMIM